MAYKDKDRQRQAVKEAVRRHRAKHVIPCNARPDVIPNAEPNVIPKEAKPYACSDGKIKHIHEPAPPQSYNPMMAGYVPPR